MIEIGPHLSQAISDVVGVALIVALLWFVFRHD
jgi:hypothetical protein